MVLKKNKLTEIFEKVLTSELCFTVETLLAAGLLLSGQKMIGLIALFALICLALLFCDDVLTTTLPFLLLCALATNFYNSFNLFMPYIIFAPIPVLCVVYHFVHYRKPFLRGTSLNGIFAVAIAILFGGIGRYSLSEYMSGAYYIFGLSIGMIVVYFILKSEFSVFRKYEICYKFSYIMTCLGLFCAFNVLYGYILRAEGVIEKLVPYGFSSNNLATLLMFALPFPIYLSKRHKPAAVFTLILYLAIFFTESRGGQLFGGIELVVCYFYFVSLFPKKVRKFCYIATVLCFIVGVCLIPYTPIPAAFRRWKETGFNDGVRGPMIYQALQKFNKSSVSGFGILDNSIRFAHKKKQGSMSWYHMMVPQVLGSMGLVGVFAYVFQFVGRAKLIFTKKTPWSLCLGLSYLGILLMSQVNPGEFCPVPFELLTILLFILQERRFLPKKTLLNQ